MNQERKNRLRHQYSLTPPVNNQLAWSKQDWYVILVLFILTMAYFHHVIIPFGSGILSEQNTDTRHQLFYWRYYGFNSIFRGILPLWNPYIYSGTPFIGGIQSALFYPPNLIFLVFPVHIAINYSIILHVFLSGVFTYIYVRHLYFFKKETQTLSPEGHGYESYLTRTSCMVSAIIFMFCAPQIFHIYPGHLPNLCTMIWLPLILLFSELFISHKKFLYAFLGGLAVACMLLAGHPQYFFYISIAVFLYFIIRIIQECKRDKNWKYAGLYSAGACILYTTGILLSAIQLLPALEMVNHSARQALTYEWVAQFSFPPENFVTFIIPDFMGDLLNVSYWGRCYLWEMSWYIGIISLMLCGIAAFYRKSNFIRLFLIIALIATVLALGKYTPLLKILYKLVPGFDMFRGNSKFSLITVFSLAVLSGFGIEYLRNYFFARKRIRSFLFITIGIVSVLGIFIIIFFLLRTGTGVWPDIIRKVYTSGDRYVTLPNLNNPDFLEATFAVAKKSALKFILLAILSLLVIGLWINGRFKKQILIPITIVLLFGDLWIFGNRYMVTFDAQECFWDKEMMATLKNDQHPSRITTIGYFEQNQGMAHEISNIGGYDANVIKEYSEFINLASNKPVEEPNIAMEVTQISKLTNMLNVKYLLLPANVRVDYPDFQLVYKDAKYGIFKNKQALPRVFVVHRAKELHGRKAIFKELTSDMFHPAEYIILEETPPLIYNEDQNVTEKERSPSVLEYNPNSVTIKATLAEDGYLVLGDTYYPGWNAYVDGEKTRVYKTNYILRSVFLEKGEHIVWFRYEPKSFTIGTVITLSAFVMLIPISIFVSKYQKNCCK